MPVSAQVINIANATTVSQFIGIPENTELRAVSVNSVTTSTGPLNATIWLYMGPVVPNTGRIAWLVSGWTRQDANGIVDAVAWFGSVWNGPDVAGNGIMFDIRNDTGAAVRASISWDTRPK
jgi:hypothetical protein